MPKLQGWLDRQRYQGGIDWQKYQRGADARHAEKGRLAEVTGRRQLPSCGKGRNGRSTRLERMHRNALTVETKRDGLVDLSEGSPDEALPNRETAITIRSFQSGSSQSNLGTSRPTARYDDDV